jgi:hypothetical protein
MRWVSGGGHAWGSTALVHLEIRAAERSEKDSRIKSANDVKKIVMAGLEGGRMS